MTKLEIVAKLKENHQSFYDYIETLTETEFNHHAPTKWNAGQQIGHILLSVSPLTNALKLPNFVITWKFGKANRPSRTFDELVARYQQKLEAAAGAPTTAGFAPEEILFSGKKNAIEKVSKQVEKLCKQTMAFSETELDTMILPHPLLGRLTLREMLYFTVYHVKHHQDLTKRNLSL
jgi:hypothetical protein